MNNNKSIIHSNLNDYLHSSQSHPITRHWQSQMVKNFSTKDFILPLFVLYDDNGSETIESFPGVKRMGQNVLLEYLSPLILELDLSAILLFPCMKQQKQNDDDSVKNLYDAFDHDKNPLLKVIPVIKEKFPQLLIITDVCLCAFTDHGHCCVFDQHSGQIDNQKSIEELAKLSVKYAQVGADVIAPSDMMDSRIALIREQLNLAGYSHVSILSYGAKFSSCFYGPFRNAAGSAPKFGDRKKYQLPSGSRGMALRSIDRDIRQGADIIMVKPAMAYLDIVRSIADHYPNYPIAVYQVSGEYSMLKHGAQIGLFDLKQVVMETIIGFKRAGASIIITYFTADILRWIRNNGEEF
ncbi:delta-aminolevulinic acid dehydratase-like protein [Euroglyphus maynei]|uniref:Delta-aminolevulinic acid dehydratase n=1 Tax=Euroglyphus maynei TaxID=6958 RepID=A0A1Y3BTK6_EURMA|nr:delta-aminolevulinic acid dehydratase-like protein [Euroglyphus maynei]